ncbi:hypothetical protein ADL21_15810 [Streptomyces albus subsp. albus]|nr:hypothetical protein ADL21_15810 [Streptomyces albus subsp. albus]
MQLRGAIGVARDDVQQRLLIVRERRVQAVRLVIEAVAYVLVARAGRVLRSWGLLLLWSLLGVRLLVVLGLCLILGVMGLRLLLGVVLVRPLMRLLGNCLLLVWVLLVFLLLVGVGLMALQGGLLVWLLVWCCLLRLQVRIGLVGSWLRLMRLLGRVGNVRVRSARLQGVRPESVLTRA